MATNINNKSDNFGVNFNSLTTNLLTQKYSDTGVVPPPPGNFIAINEDNLSIIELSDGSLLTTN